LATITVFLIVCRRRSVGAITRGVYEKQGRVIDIGCRDGTKAWTVYSDETIVERVSQGVWGGLDGL
jgi:hypothetical protein